MQLVLPIPADSNRLGRFEIGLTRCPDELDSHLSREVRLESSRSVDRRVQFVSNFAHVTLDTFWQEGGDGQLEVVEVFTRRKDPVSLHLSSGIVILAERPCGRERQKARAASGRSLYRRRGPGRRSRRPRRAAG